MKNQKLSIDFIGIGAAKSATTWIAERLREHPDICVSYPKETSFFISDNFSKGASWYAKNFAHCKNSKIKGEFSPQYLTRTEVPENIKEFAPNAKLIVCLRNPVERFLSGYRFTKATGRHNIPLTAENIETKFKVELERGMYYKYLKRYFDMFPREQILILFTEDIRKNALSEIQKVFRFLGVDDNFIPPNLSQEKNLTSEAQARFPSLNKIIFRWHKKTTLGKLRILAPVLKTLKFHILAQKIRLWNKKMGPRKTESGGFDKIVMEKLSAYYRQDILKLQKLTGKDLSFWIQKNETL